jgi:hypothetical protein
MAHQPAAALPLRRRASITASAHEARRACTLSARLVRMIGTRAPSTMPAPRRGRQEGQLLGQHVAGLEVGHDQDVGAAGDRRDDALDPRRLQVIALSKASGPSSRPPVIWPRSAILHSAAASSVEGIAA